MFDLFVGVSRHQTDQLHCDLLEDREGKDPPNKLGVVFFSFLLLCPSLLLRVVLDYFMKEERPCLSKHSLGYK